jgi:hypothetical protein
VPSRIVRAPSIRRRGTARISRILGQHPGRVGDDDTALVGGGEVDMVDAGAERRDEFELVARRHDDVAVDPVGHGGDQHVCGLHRLGQGRGRHGRVVAVQPRFKQLHHPGFDGVRKPAGDDDGGFLFRQDASPCCGLYQRFTQSRRVLSSALRQRA